MDFPNAKLPELLPLKNSVAQENWDIESELKAFFLFLWSYANDSISFDSDKYSFDDAITSFDNVGQGESLATKSFDVNVLGMGQLGSLELVRRMINRDGLVLLEGDREETATRYTYKSWVSQSNQGRGFHFLRTYLQQLFPNAHGIEQLAQPKSLPYPQGLIPCIGADDINYFLTSRILILLNYDDVSWKQIDRMSPILRDVIAARFIVHFGKLVTVRPKTYVSCVALTGAIVTVYPYQAGS
ncbi:MAG: hypothetical protein RIR39_2100 [Pseudomonadota bacterium]